MRLYRQPAPGDWAPVIGEIIGDLASRHSGATPHI
jgi:hypothetical protein